MPISFFTPGCADWIRLIDTGCFDYLRATSLIKPSLNFSSSRSIEEIGDNAYTSYSPIASFYLFSALKAIYSPSIAILFWTVGMS